MFGIVANRLIKRKQYRPLFKKKKIGIIGNKSIKTMKYLGEQIMEEQGFCELSFSFFHIENCCLLVGTKVKSNIKETVY